jgi:type VI secretion system protein ImpF
MRQRFTPGLFDRLITDRFSTADGECVTELNLDQLKEAVARDLEELLNTRLAIAPDLLADYPACRDSVVNYGLIDFSSMNLKSSFDRDTICAALKACIERFEPRLRAVRATLRPQAGPGARVDFAISALLHVHAAAEPVQFDASMDAATQQYAIRSACRAARNGAE